MRAIHIITLATALMAIASVGVFAQTNGSTATLRRGSKKTDGAHKEQITNRTLKRISMPSATDSEKGWMRVIYRELDLNKPGNAPLYYPEPPIEGQENLFRTIMGLVSSGRLKVYEYMDGREIFNDQHQLSLTDMLERFHIPYRQSKKNSAVEIDEADVPGEEVLSYYIIERHELDSKNTRKRTVVEAICPVLHRSDELAIDPVKYPMFWVKFDDLRPYLSGNAIFVSDENNMPSCTYDDFFLLGLYDGEIVKTRNARNKSLAELYPDPVERKKIQDSIDTSLENTGGNMWVPSMEQLQASRLEKEKAEILAAGGDTSAVKDPAKYRRQISKRGTKKQNALKIKTKRAKAPKNVSSSSSATRSVRNRKR